MVIAVCTLVSTPRFQCILKCQGVQNRCQHPHIIGCCPVHPRFPAGAPLHIFHRRQQWQPDAQSILLPPVSPFCARHRNRSEPPASGQLLRSVKLSAYTLLFPYGRTTSSKFIQHCNRFCKKEHRSALFLLFRLYHP